MRRASKTTLKIVAAVAILPFAVVTLVALMVSVYTGPHFSPPSMPDGWDDGVTVTEDVDGTLRCRRSQSQTVKEGLTVVTLRGNAAERGADYAALCGSLIRRQEEVFLSRTIEAVGGQWALRAMLWVADAAGFDFSKFMTEDLRQETWAMAQACAPHSQYDDLGDAYTRQILYQAAHDMGHAMSQHLNLKDVKAGCSSFAVRGHRAAGRQLIEGRNFDFYFGDEFAKQKMILIEEPDSGPRHMSVCWPGMLGVVSGMNSAGLSVTINAAPAEIPLAPRTPVTALTRQILTNATTIAEAEALAAKARLMVGESVMICSVADSSAAVIEMGPQGMATRRMKDDRIISANHFETAAMNPRGFSTADSRARHDRLEAMTDSLTPIGTAEAIAILRDKTLPDGSQATADDDMAINQTLAHHAVVLLPDSLALWVATEPGKAAPFLRFELAADAK